MAEVTLTNKADFAGNYGESAVPITFSTNEVTTTIVQGITVTKSADKSYWVDGPLTYTITVENSSGSSIASIKLTDTLDTSLVEFNTTYGVQVNGQATTDFTYASGLLTINLQDIADSGSSTVTFQVTLK